MRSITGWVLSLLLLGYGLIRIGVGGALLAQSLDLIHFAPLADALSEVNGFIDARASKQLLPFSAPGYFAYIMLMGVLLAAGAAGVMRYKIWGFTLLGVYLLLHAALFINYQEINPKLITLAVQILMFMVLVYLRPPKKNGILKAV